MRDPIYSESSWVARQISINESQLSELYGLKGKENFKTIYSLTVMFLSIIGLIFFLLVVIHPSGELLVSSRVFQFSGVFCIFFGYALYISSQNFYEHRAILKQTQEYIYQQRKAIEAAKEALFKVKAGKHVF